MIVIYKLLDISSLFLNIHSIKRSLMFHVRYLLLEVEVFVNVVV